jgi:uncharacterized protein
MPRPNKPRRIRYNPAVTYFKPQGIPLRRLENIELGLDEVEALRLADLEEMSHEEVGEKMEISRATVGRILARARSKVAMALTQGLAIRIEAGEVPAEERENEMPDNDRTGPQGQGPRTGRGQGRCGGPVENTTNEQPGRGLGRGRGAGPGRGAAAGKPAGRGRGQGGGPGRGGRGRG